MTSERWQQIWTVYEQAVELETAERPAYLNQTCASDDELRNEVESLLRSEKRAGSAFLQSPAADLLQPLHSEELSSRVGNRIGVYQVLEKLGHGGMGDVYRAARADGQYDKQVAVKLVRVGLDSSSILQRFRHERQILASLEHPNIARLLDGGTTEDGIPYLVMELIEGERIDNYCDAHTLSISQRLQLFRQVCSAVQYAHQRLVIHRDIKPSNILVTKEGMPKLLDFGIAKILDPTADVEVTMARPMTPEYASPEQVRGDAITTATDVYSLGVVLFKLLTGRFPYRVSGGSQHEFSRAISETEPLRPSMVALKSAGPETAEILSRAREGSPIKLQRRLAGDLDDILLMTLRKEPERRYASVQQFDEDISRHLLGMPVTAGKGSWRYRAEKFVGRHRVGVIAAALGLCAVVIGIGLILREARIAQAERQRAEDHFNDVRKLANSLVFDVNDAMADLPGNTAARKILLDRAVEYLDKLSADSAGNSDLQRDLAWGYQRLAMVQGNTTVSNVGQVANADVSIHKSIALFESVAKANPHNMSDQLDLAMAHRTMGYSDLYYPTGRPELEKALAITDQLTETYGKDARVQSERSTEYFLLSESQSIWGDHPQSMDSLRKSLALAKEILSNDPNRSNAAEQVATTSLNLSKELAMVGAWDESRQQAQAAIAAYEGLINKKSRPDLVRELAIAHVQLGKVELLHGDDTAAKNDLDLAQQMLSRLLKLEPENVMLQSDSVGLGFAQARWLALEGRFKQAAAKELTVISACFNIKSDAETQSPGLLYTWLGEAQFGMHNYVEALQSFQKAAAALEKEVRYDEARWGIPMIYTRLGDTLLKLNRLQEADAAYQKAQQNIDPTFAYEHKDNPAFYSIAAVYGGAGDLSMAHARATKDPEEQAKFRNIACSSYKKSMDTWRQIIQPSRFNPYEFPASNPRDVIKALAECEGHLPE